MRCPYCGKKVRSLKNHNCYDIWQRALVSGVIMAIVFMVLMLIAINLK